MRKLVLKMSMSLDGFVGGPNGEKDWMMRSKDEGAAEWVVETLWGAGLHIMGNRTYNETKGYWPTAATPFAAPMNAIPKVAFTRQKIQDMTTRNATGAAQASSDWADALILGGDLAEQVNRLKAEDSKYILAHGGAGFARSLVRLGLVDEYRLVVHPVLLGSGQPLFSELERPQDLKLVSTTLFKSGTAAHVYRPA
jgi:dihydrofolate reductase